ncbi:MAG: sugar phosphate isomerase/epimerase [Verrucomicrobiaceae bacterium]|nr:sugar phosphate isomerase/epimerase [Verrucomicrobiaceae bacterium]
MNRRLFLQSATAAALTPSIVRAANAIPSIGFSLYGMKDIPLDTALKTCAEIGYTHVELTLNSGYVTEPSKFNKQARNALAEQLKSLKLSVPCLMISASLTNSDDAHKSALKLIADAAELGRDVSPDAPPVMETVLGGKPATWEEQKAGMLEKLRDWAATAEKVSATITIKAHVGSAVNSPERLLWLLDQVKSPAIQAAYDFSHFEVQGMDMEATMKALLPRTKFIHVKDTQGEAPAGKKPNFQFLLPGQGRTDYIKYFKLLKAHNYTGPVCVEVSGQVFNKPGYDPIAAARSSFAALSKALQAAS